MFFVENFDKIPLHEFRVCLSVLLAFFCLFFVVVSCFRIDCDNGIHGGSLLVERTSSTKISGVNKKKKERWSKFAR